MYIRNTAYICNIYSTNALAIDSYNQNIDIIQINLTWGLDYEESKREFRINDKNVNVKNLLIIEINMEYYKKIWYSKDEKKIKENELLVMLDLNEKDQRKMQNSLIREAEDSGYEKGIKFGEEKGKEYNVHISMDI